jgi:hypothetical protein
VKIEVRLNSSQANFFVCKWIFFCEN